MIKKILKKMVLKDYEKSFTALGHYQPKMPKALKASIDKKKD